MTALLPHPPSTLQVWPRRAAGLGMERTGFAYVAQHVRSRSARRGPAPLLLAMGLLGVLAGCASRYPAGVDVDTSIEAVGQDSRVRFIVLHYTASGTGSSLHTLSRNNVSAHYMVDDSAPVKVYRLVSESRNAWHAGASSWYGHTSINNASIGIEIVNEGKVLLPDGSQRWEDYPERQVVMVIRLVRAIASRHGVRPQNIVGHSDVAPQRKVDPGPRFPWRRLALAGLGRWYDEAAAQIYQHQFDIVGIPDANWFQSELARVGYDVPRTGMFDESTRRVIAAFQMHYRPERCDGFPDTGTAAILRALPAGGSIPIAGTGR